MDQRAIDLRTVKTKPSRESMYRQGYRAGWIAAVNFFANATENERMNTLCNMAQDFWLRRLVPWARGDESWLPPRMDCQNCHSTQRLQIDHIVPSSKGGEDKMSNYQLLCAHCNISKGAGPD